MTKEEVKQFVDDMMENFVDERLVVDPPSGWRYGFPKTYFKNNVGDMEELRNWLLSEGYPQREIDACGDYFPVRFWRQRD
jgi:hypothetical protein